MAKMSPEERAELEARLAADDEDDDDGDELEIEFEGKRVRGTYRRVAEVASAWGFKLRPDSPAEPETGKGKSGKGDGGEVRRFAGRRVS